MVGGMLGNLSDRHKRIAIAAGIALMTMIFISSAVIEPANKKIKALQIQKNELREKEPLLRDVLNSETRILSFKTNFIPTRDLAPIMEILTDLAEKSSIKISSITPEKSGALTESDIEKVLISIEASGSFHQLGDYVSRIESLDKSFVRISRLDFGKISSAGTAEVAGRPEVKRIYLTVALLYASKDLVAA